MEQKEDITVSEVGPSCIYCKKVNPLPVKSPVPGKTYFMDCIYCHKDFAFGMEPQMSEDDFIRAGKELGIRVKRGTVD